MRRREGEEVVGQFHASFCAEQGVNEIRQAVGGLGHYDDKYADKTKTRRRTPFFFWNRR